MADENIENEDFLKPFLSDDFDEKKFATKIIQAQTVSDYLGKINESITRLDSNLQHHVSHHHQDLLSQAVGIEKLESVLDLMLTRTETLVSGLAKIRRRITDPHDSLVTRLSQLRRMQTTCDTLRKTVRVVYLTKRLQGQNKDVTKASASINELEYLFDSVNWEGIEVLEQNRRISQQIRQDLESQAWTLVMTPFESATNQTQFGLGLQVFHNLNNLPAVINKLLTDWKASFNTSLQSAIDTKALSSRANSTLTAPGRDQTGPGRATLSTGSQAAAFRAALWTNLDHLLDDFYQCASRVRLLQKILAKKRDPNTQRSLLACLLETNPDPELAGFLDPDCVEPKVTFVSWSAERIQDKLLTAVDQSAMLRQVFEGEYPKLARLVQELGRKLIDLFGGGETDSQSGAGSSSNCSMPASFVLFMEPLETAYLTRSLTRLLDPIEMTFSSEGDIGGGGSTGGVTVLSRDEMDNLVKNVCSELTLASGDERLQAKVGNNVGKMARLLATRVERCLVVDGEASQVVGPLTAGQLVNIKLINCLQLFRVSMEKSVLHQLRLPISSCESIRASLREIVALMRSGLQPLLQSVADSLEAIIITMHQERFDKDNSSRSGSSKQCSLYMQELQDFIVRVQSQYLSAFSCPELLASSLLPHVIRCVDIFLIHASLLRDLSEPGKMRLAADCAELEMAVSPLCGRVSDLGPAYRRLRNFRPLLFQSTEVILENPQLGTENLPVSLVLHHLFSRCPQELRSPFHTAGWSVSRYNNWLLDHTLEEDRLQFIKGTLDAYAQSVRSKLQREYAEIYPQMLELLQKSLRSSR